MKRFVHFVLALVLVLSVSSCGKKPPAETPSTPPPSAGPTGQARDAQDGGGGGRPGFQALREQYKAKFQLMGTVRRLSRLTGDGTLVLSSEQAAKLLPVLQELKAKETLSEDECKDYDPAIKKLLTPEQLQTLAEAQSQWRGGGEGGGPGTGGGPGGPGKEGGKGGGKGFDPSQMETLNPFAGEGRVAQSMDSLIAALAPPAES